MLFRLPLTFDEPGTSCRNNVTSQRASGEPAQIAIRWQFFR